jgi:hypothetical protein
MLSFVTLLLILSAGAAPNSETRHPDAVAVFDCQFDPPWDVNFDNWPDNWRRTIGPGLPHYVGVSIGPDEVDDSNRCLTVRVDGGGAHLESPLVTVSDNFSYKTECRLRIQGIGYARTQVRVQFYDDNDNLLQTESTPWIASTPKEQWVQLHIGPVNPASPAITVARIILHIEPGERADLKGMISLDDVWMARLPKMTVTTGSPYNVYTKKEDVEVTCDLSGILDSDPDILFELLDASSQRIENSRVQLEGKLITERRSKASEFVGVTETQRAAYAGSTSWRPPIVKHGFYKVRVTMQNSRGMMDRRVVNIALVPPLEQLERPARGEFGWSLAGDNIPLSLPHLGQLLPEAAVHWVKMPVWYSENEPQRGDDLVMFSERAAANHIDIVGVVDRPPADSELAKRLAADASIADTLMTDPANWLPLLDPVLTRLSLRVRWWQFGADHDASLSSIANAEAAITKLRDQLFRFGQDVNIGVGWKWLQQSAVTTPPPWAFQQFATTPSLTGPELGEYLKLPRRERVARWVLIEPLSRNDYDLDTRARDLVEQMLAAKINGADAIFASRPFDDERGLMTEEGAPGELLLPWRTTASLLSSTTYLGSIELPQHSHNRLFMAPSGDVLMVVWSDAPTEEFIQFGDEVRVLDVWGRQQSPRRVGDRQAIDVAAMPKFVLGVNSAIARWGMGVRFTKLHVPSVFGKAHPNSIEITNTFAQGVGGTITLIGPKGWQISPGKIEFKLAAGETAKLPFEITLPFNASSGATPVRAQFSVDVDRTYQFAADRELLIGDGQIQIETTTRIDEEGTLLVEQRMVNLSPQLVDFKCMLYAPESDRRRQRMQVFRLGSSPDVKIYRYPNGADLIGTEMWLRAEEVNGSRALNHRFTVEQ